MSNNQTLEDQVNARLHGLIRALQRIVSQKVSSAPFESLNAGDQFLYNDPASGQLVLCARIEPDAGSTTFICAHCFAPAAPNAAAADGSAVYHFCPADPVIILTPPNGLDDRWFVARAKEKYHDEGTLEIDDHAIVSRPDDMIHAEGAYVQAWVWVPLPCNWRHRRRQSHLPKPKRKPVRYRAEKARQEVTP